MLDAPAQVQLLVQDVRRVPFLEIRDRLGRELIAVLELLSPSNKRGGGDREQYLAKRAANPRQCRPLRGDRPAASRPADAPAESTQVRLLRAGQPGRHSTPRRVLAPPLAPAPARHPDPAATGGSGCPDRSPGCPPRRVRCVRLRGLHLCWPTRSSPPGQGCCLGSDVRAADSVSGDRANERRGREDGDSPADKHRPDRSGSSRPVRPGGGPAGSPDLRAGIEATRAFSPDRTTAIGIREDCIRRADPANGFTRAVTALRIASRPGPGLPRPHRGSGRTP